MRSRVHFVIKEPLALEGITLPAGRRPGFKEVRAYSTYQGPDAASPRYWIEVSEEEFKHLGGGRNSAGATIELARYVRQGLVEVE